MGKKRGQVGGSRRSRLDISEANENEEADDPIAAAIAAKAKRQGMLLQAYLSVNCVEPFASCSQAQCTIPYG